MTHERLQYLIDQHNNQRMSSMERAELLDLLENIKISGLPADSAAYVDNESPTWPEQEALPVDAEKILQGIFASDKIITGKPAVTPVHRVHFLRKWGWAAAVMAVIGTTIAIALLFERQSDKKGSGLTATSPDVLPGGDKAVLTLADGSKIILDSVANGNLAQQGNATIVKLDNGQIAYNLKGVAGNEVMMNTMATPRGGQYQLTLPDGSKVWLNAASSIQFPVAFAGATRGVKISGEAYFEVAQNKEKPFIVDVDGKSSIQVLGTGFNVNAYADEENVKATLMEGSIRISLHTDAKAPDDAQSGVILKPGQQAVLRIPDRGRNGKTNPGGHYGQRESISVQAADIEQTLAWKNGLFNFNGLALPVVLRQLERWYDIKVKYEGSLPELIFRGEMYRSADLSDALDILQKLGVKCRLEGKTLFIL